MSEDMPKPEGRSAVSSSRNRNKRAAALFDSLAAPETSAAVWTFGGRRDGEPEGSRVSVGGEVGVGEHDGELPFQRLTKEEPQVRRPYGRGACSRR